MDFMQNIHILPMRPKKRCLFPKEDGTPEATGASRGEKRTESLTVFVCFAKGWSNCL